MFQLVRNYRSHAGIVNCARSVVELIQLFWPESIDTLAPEHGQVAGAQPYFHMEASAQTFRIEDSFSSKQKGMIDLGAAQCNLFFLFTSD
jgi:hypothetical protein